MRSAAILLCTTCSKFFLSKFTWNNVFAVKRTNFNFDLSSNILRMWTRSIWRRWWRRQHRKRRIDTSIVCYRLVCGSKHNSATEVLKSKLYLLYVLINKACICVRFYSLPLALALSGALCVCILLEYLFDDIFVLLDLHWSSYVRMCVCDVRAYVCCASVRVFVHSLCLLHSSCQRARVCVCMLRVFVFVHRLFVYSYTTPYTHVLCVLCI